MTRWRHARFTSLYHSSYYTASSTAAAAAAADTNSSNVIGWRYGIGRGLYCVMFWRLEKVEISVHIYISICFVWDDSRNKSDRMPQGNEPTLQYTPQTSTRRNCRVESHRRRWCEHNSQLAHDDCWRVRSPGA